MIVGFDYQNKEIVAREFEGLMKLKPALAQFLIYGPVPGTPFYKRIVQDNLLRESYSQDQELFYRRGDGFAAIVKHPTLSAEEIEEIQRWCFQEDFERLGPSIFRTLEARLLGYQKLKDSPNRFLRQKAEFYGKELRAAYPAFLAGRLLGPNRAVRRRIGELQQRIHAEFGAPALLEQCRSLMAVGAALWTGLTLKLNLFQHPKLLRTEYRMPAKRWTRFDLWEEFQRKTTAPNLFDPG